MGCHLLSSIFLFKEEKYSHGLLPSLFFFVIVLGVALGDFLLSFFPEGLAVCVVVRSGGVLHGSRPLAALQSVSKLDHTTHSTSPVSARAASPNSRLVHGMSGRLSLGSLMPRREKRFSFRFPACRSIARISATSRASASICAWVGYGFLRLEASRRRVVWASVCRYRFSRALLCSAVN